MLTYQSFVNGENLKSARGLVENSTGDQIQFLSKSAEIMGSLHAQIILTLRTSSTSNLEGS